MDPEKYEEIKAWTLEIIQKERKKDILTSSKAKIGWLDPEKYEMINLFSKMDIHTHVSHGNGKTLREN